MDLKAEMARSTNQVLTHSPTIQSLDTTPEHIKIRELMLGYRAIHTLIHQEYEKFIQLTCLCLKPKKQANLGHFHLSCNL